MKLSVMVISHNQAHLIRRCLDSILAQRIDAPWEIVISDDASTDDTWGVIQEYVKQYPVSKKSGEVYVPKIRAYQINSSDYNPTVTSDRCAANKANVYMHAEGEYCVNIDADDYLKSEEIYAYQISQLDAHPECSVAVQNIWYQYDGELVEKGHSWHPQNIWKENEVIDLEEYCHRRAFISNPAFMMRRDEILNPMEKYGLLFDDPIISMHHLIRGKIVCSKRADYVYVQYRNSIWNQVGRDESDTIIRNLAVLTIYLKLFPEKKYIFLEMEVYNWIVCLKKIIARNIPLQPSKQTKAYLYKLNNRCLKRVLNRNRMYIRFLLNFALLINKTSKFKGLMAAIFCNAIK